MRDFWNERAEENAFFFVDNSLDYRHPDAERFWSDGAMWLDRLLGELDAELAPTDEVVEIGCGVGRLTRVIARRAAGVRALDISERMLDRARELCSDLDNVSWVLGDGTSLQGIEDASADVCVSHVVFQHIPDPEITLGYVREIGRVLRPGGWGAFQISNEPQLHRRRTGLEAAKILLRALTLRGPKGQADPHWLGSSVEVGQLRRAASEGGMEVERVSGEGKQMCFVLVRHA